MKSLEVLKRAANRLVRTAKLVEDLCALGEHLAAVIALRASKRDGDPPESDTTDAVLEEVHGKIVATCEQFKRDRTKVNAADVARLCASAFETLETLVREDDKLPKERTNLAFGAIARVGFAAVLKTLYLKDQEAAEHEGARTSGDSAPNAATKPPVIPTTAKPAAKPEPKPSPKPEAKPAAKPQPAPASASLRPPKAAPGKAAVGTSLPAKPKPESKSAAGGDGQIDFMPVGDGEGGDNEAPAGAVDIDQLGIDTEGK